MGHVAPSSIFGMMRCPGPHLEATLLVFGSRPFLLPINSSGHSPSLHVEIFTSGDGAPTHLVSIIHFLCSGSPAVSPTLYCQRKSYRQSSITNGDVAAVFCISKSADDVVAVLWPASLLTHYHVQSASICPNFVYAQFASTFSEPSLYHPFVQRPFRICTSELMQEVRIHRRFLCNASMAEYVGPTHLPARVTTRAFQTHRMPGTLRAMKAQSGEHTWPQYTSGTHFCTDTPVCTRLF